MIVKDEAAVIARCLSSVAPLCDYIVISDTGSTDGTVEIVERFLAERGLPGRVERDAWSDFAHNRNLSLARLAEREDIDYCLTLDADEVMEVCDGFAAERIRAALRKDLYDIVTSYGAIRYVRPQLFRNRMGFHYRGVLHEFLQAPEGEISRAVAEGLVNRPVQDGARSRSPDKYAKDAEALSGALARETDPYLATRYQFYLAQSLRDAGELEPAIAAYRRRAELGGWDEELFSAHYEQGKLLERALRPAEAAGAYLAAFNANPRRAESLHALARMHRLRSEFPLAYLYARAGAQIAPPTSGLFLEPWVYEWGLTDELSLAAYWTGRYDESRDLCARLLAGPATPTAQVPRLRANLQFALDRLAEPGVR